MNDDAELERWLSIATRRAQAARRRRDRMVRALAAFWVFAFLLLAWLFQQQQGRLDRVVRQNRIDAVVTCEAVNGNARKFNELVDTLILRTQQSSAIPAAQKAEALRLYNAAHQDVPVCEPPKEKP